MSWYEDPALMVKRRKEAGLSQADLAKKIGRSRSLVRDVERGVIKLRGDLADAIWHAIAEARLARKNKADEIAAKLTVGDLKKTAIEEGWISKREAAKLPDPDDLRIELLLNGAEGWIDILRDAFHGNITPESISALIKKSDRSKLKLYASALELVSKLIERWREQIKAAMESKAK